MSKLTQTSVTENYLLSFLAPSMQQLAAVNKKYNSIHRCFYVTLDKGHWVLGHQKLRIFGFSQINFLYISIFHIGPLTASK
jgi:predicted transglutaminase-like cysteine proteinase